MQMGEIIAMFAGHVHGDSIDTTTMACPILTILSAGATANEHNGFSEPDSGRTEAQIPKQTLMWSR